MRRSRSLLSARGRDKRSTLNRISHGSAGYALVDAVDALSEGRASETPQDESEATYARKIEKADGIVDWSRPAREIHNQIRGLHPWPHAYSDLQGERTILLRVRKWTAEQHESHTRPGTVVEARPDRFAVQTGGGVRSTADAAARGPASRHCP